MTESTSSRPSRPTAGVLIVDDEPHARRRLRRLVAAHTGVELLGESTHGVEAVSAIRDLRPDIVFLDIRMPDLDGFGVVQRIGAEAMPVVVFVTAFDQYALDAFRHHALDYLLKPFSDERFAETLDRALARLQEKRSGALYAQLAELVLAHQGRRPGSPAVAASPPREEGRLRRIAVHKGEQTLLVQVADVEWIEAEGTYARLHTDAGSYLVRRPLRSLESQLGEDFVRIHRSTIVRIDRVVAMSPLFHGELELRLRSGARVKLSRSYRHQVRRLRGE